MPISTPSHVLADRNPFAATTIANGLRVLVIRRPGTSTIASKIFIKAGSRWDGERHGIAHCLEHALFRGTATRSSEKLYAMIEDLGGRIQGETVKDYLSLSVVTGTRHYRTGLEILADVLRNPRFDPAGFESEKGVILSEIAQRADTRQIVWDLYDLTLWQAHPLRHRALGYESVVRALTVDDVAAHYRRFCVPPAAVLVVCGDCHPDSVLSVVERLYGGWSGARPEYPPAPAEPPLVEIRRSTLEYKIRQLHMLVGWPEACLRHPDSYVLKVIDRLLGAGGRSRLYRQLRERRGLAYAVYTARGEFEDTGHFTVYAATDPGWAQEALDLTLAEVRRLQVEPVAEAELRGAQMNYEGSMAVSFETNLSLAGIAGLETLLAGEFEPFAEAARRVCAVTPQDVMRAAARYLDPERYALATVGPRETQAR